MARSIREMEARDQEYNMTRDMEARTHEMRHAYVMDWRSPLSIPEGAIRDGYVGRWAATIIDGAPVREVEDLARKGWEMVPADRVKNYLSYDPLGRNPFSGKFIATVDMILMEYPEHKLRMERDAFHNYNRNRVANLRGVRDSLGNVSNTGNFTSYRSINSF